MAKFTWRHLLSTPLFLPFPGERLRGKRRALLVAETLVSAETMGLSPLPGEGGAGWVDGQRGQRLVLSPFYPSFFSPLQGRDLGSDVVLREERRRFPEPKRPGLKSPPWRGLVPDPDPGTGRVGRWATGPTVGASYYLPLSTG
jgi:hypothetical protein